MNNAAEGQNWERRYERSQNRGGREVRAQVAHTGRWIYGGLKKGRYTLGGRGRSPSIRKDRKFILVGVEGWRGRIGAQ